MELQKRVRTELRDLIAQKKVEQESYTALVAEVNNLREERILVTESIQSEKSAHQQFLSTFKREVDFLSTEKDTITDKLTELREQISQQQIKQTELNNSIFETEKEYDRSILTTVTAKNDAKQVLDLLDQTKLELQVHQVKERELNTALKFVKSKLALSELEHQALQNKIKEASILLQSIIKEQSRHSNWDLFLQEKENFLIEQFNFLGVKYIVYNNR